jgi:hypothetical protein
VDEACEYAPMFSEYTKSPILSSGNSALNVIVSNASHVGPNTAEIYFSPSLKVLIG